MNMPYQRATIPVAVVLVEKTLCTCTGRNDPAWILENSTSSPPMVKTRRFPAPPTYNTQPLLPLPSWLEILGILTVSLGVTTAARPT